MKISYAFLQGCGQDLAKSQILRPVPGWGGSRLGQISLILDVVTLPFYHEGETPGWCDWEDRVELGFAKR